MQREVAKSAEKATVIMQKTRPSVAFYSIERIGRVGPPPPVVLPLMKLELLGKKRGCPERPLSAL